MTRLRKSLSRRAHRHAIFDKISAVIYAFFTGTLIVRDHGGWAILAGIWTIVLVFSATHWTREERRYLELERRAAADTGTRHNLDDVARELNIDPEKEDDQ